MARQGVSRMAFTLIAASVLLLSAAPAQAQEWLCDASYENCRTPLIDLIRNENVGLDVAFWFMEDGRISAARLDALVSEYNAALQREGRDARLASVKTRLPDAGSRRVALSLSACVRDWSAASS